MSPVLCTKDELLDWTEITKSGTVESRFKKDFGSDLNLS